MLERDREGRGFTVGQVANRLGIRPEDYRAILAGGSMNYDTWQAICELYGWPQTFVTGVRR